MTSRRDPWGPEISRYVSLPWGPAEGSATEVRMSQPGGLAKEVPRPLANPRPLCTIPFNVSMSKAKTGTFDGAHQPVFVYLAARLKTKIRIRFQVSISYADCVILPSSHRPQIEGTLWDEMEERPFHDGKSITKGDLAMSIARKLEKALVCMLVRAPALRSML